MKISTYIAAITAAAASAATAFIAISLIFPPPAESMTSANAWARLYRSDLVLHVDESCAIGR